MSGEVPQGRLREGIVIFRDRGRLHFRTIFDRVGAVAITLVRGQGSQRTVIERYTHTLTEDLEIGNLIDTIDAVLAIDWTGTPSERRDTLVESGLTAKTTNSLWQRLKQYFNDGARLST